MELISIEGNSTISPLVDHYYLLSNSNWRGEIFPGTKLMLPKLLVSAFVHAMDLFSSSSPSFFFSHLL